MIILTKNVKFFHRKLYANNIYILPKKINEIIIRHQLCNEKRGFIRSMSMVMTVR